MVEGLELYAADAALRALIGKSMVTPDDSKNPALPLSGDPDAHGQAALLLSESILHGLVARSVISVADALEMVDIAADVKTELFLQEKESDSTILRSLDLLAAIRVSLEVDRSGPPVT